MLKEYPCNLCGSKDNVVIYPSTALEGCMCVGSMACTNEGHGEHYQIVRCRRCGLIFSSPRPDDIELEAAYQSVRDDIYAQQLEGRVRTFDRNLDNLARFCAGGKLMDVGCALGVFLSRALRRGWNVRGIEPSLWCVEKSKELFNVAVEQGTYKDLLRSPGMFDVITLWDVLEHISDPTDALKACNMALRVGGVLAFSTVDAGSLYARVLGQRWPWLMKMHIHYFDRKTIHAYLCKAGFDVLEIRNYRHTISLEYLEYKLKAVNVILYGVMGLLRKMPFMADVFVTVAMGDFMEVYARKLVDAQPK
jgi:2-polyprenyl-3-methyl-5-hydroxy-6-metoxy-1,4-benzoquinol methylase